jgi:hypothetical protein
MSGCASPTSVNRHVGGSIVCRLMYRRAVERIFASGQSLIS